MEKELEQYLNKIKGIPSPVENNFTGNWHESKPTFNSHLEKTKGLWR